VTNADILCDHGAVRRELRERLGQLAVALSARQYEALAAAYGASEPPLLEVRLCRECEAERISLEARRQRERNMILRVDSDRQGAGQVWFLTSEVWLARWRAFINNDGATDGTGRGVLPPGPIDNSRLLGKNGRPLPNLRGVTHYRGVNEAVWTFLRKIYGGGPALPHAKIDIYSAPAPNPAPSPPTAKRAAGAAAQMQEDA
jgi:hypothetical protein